LVPKRSFYFRHLIISFLRDIDIKGFRKLSLLAPKILIPNPHKLGKYVLKTVNGYQLLIDPKHDTGVERSLHDTGTYEKGMLHFLKENLGQGDVFVDVGANIGLLSLHASKFVGATGKVLAFEAHPETAKILQENKKLNQNQTIQIYPIALGADIGKVMIYDDMELNRGGASLVRNGKNSGGGIEAEMIRLDDVLEEDIIPRIIKIDVEGYELNVLKGAVKTIQIAKPILLIEASNKKEDNAAIISFLNQIHPYKIYKFQKGKERKSKWIEFKSLDEIPSHDNLIFLP
jgi:FkbM family methyltransferase